MPRRPLRKISPSLDLSQRLLLPDALPRPWSAAALFGRDAPLEIEVGSGKGLFLSAAAAACPQHDFLGIEIAERYAHFCAAKMVRLGLENTRIVHGDALPIFSEVLPDESVDAVHVYFPDPWWKKRHKKRRVLNERFVRNVERVLHPDGILHFWTDVEEYFHATLDLIRAVTKLSGPHEVAEKPPEHDLDFRTHFERRTRMHGEQVYRAQFYKLAK